MGRIKRMVKRESYFEVINSLQFEECNDALRAMYSTERKYLDSQRSAGIAVSAKNGNYKGRERIKIDKHTF